MARWEGCSSARTYLRQMRCGNREHLSPGKVLTRPVGIRIICIIVL